MRFNADISDTLNDKIKKHVPVGNQAEVLRKLFNLLFDLCEENPAAVYFLLADKLEMNIVSDCSTIEHKEE